MKIYRVGGAVRDALLGLSVQDIDYVVVGSTPEEMVAQGYTPVGKDFPVFLHPVTHAEYALARTERKSAPGYHGFVFHCAPDVTLEQDLQRRDLTINAMAIADDNGGADSVIIDPHNGQRDLVAGIFRHVSDAFAEDPVRILRVARFAARFGRFQVAPETMQLMRKMVGDGEADALVPERVWQELARGLMEAEPSRMLQVLHDCGALARIMPELDWSGQSEAYRSHQSQIVDFAAEQKTDLAVRWAALLATCALPKCRSLCARLKVPGDIRDIALITCAERQSIHDVLTHSAPAILALLERCDAIRRPARFADMIQALRCCYQLAQPFAQQTLLEQALAAAMSIPAKQIAQDAARQYPNEPQQIPRHISAARIEAIAALAHFKN